ncbi:DUF2933 domain-containing protein [Aromatoleum diolicum]|uniref:DUF2933 domain-containing protein n=1 Tax=Aromatoleum diolicum TaxID=75796 RepID=A0ABX1QEW8_9RHOO|nr:DUF2933 domain-containing protein [Aromatoleum diolicum]NMG76972.1 DUF2933 domain-containing protein [Aromatoleum diolicum]
MHTHHPPDHAPPDAATGDRRVSASRWIFGAFIAMAAVLLAFEHRAHLLGILPWLFLLACPLMHLFMHHGHQHGDPKNGGGK